MIRSSVFVSVALAVASCGGDGPSGASCDSWTQWGQAAEHRGTSCVAGQPMTRSLRTITYDTLVEDEKTDAGGELLVHYQTPLTVDDDLYMMWKDGVYTPCVHTDNMPTVCDPYRTQTQVWSEKGYRWENGTLSEKWTFASDWKPMPGPGNLTFEPMFQPAVFGDFIYVPGAGGTVHKLGRKDGLPITRLQPFGATVDPDRYVTGPITVDGDGNLYYNSVKLDHDHPYTTDAEAELVKISADGTMKTASFAAIVSGAPAPTDLCRGAFTNPILFPRPWPPADDENGKVLPPTFPCQSQRPSWNIAPAIGPDGTVYTVSRAHATDRVAFVVAVNPDLSPKWTRSLKNIYDDACGGPFLPIDGDENHPFDCRIGTTPGIDPNTNEMPSGRAIDSSSSSPVALPDGSVLYGTYTGYNIARGHLVKLSATGAVVANFGFGWDVTPAVWQHDGTYSIVIKDNYYTFDQNGTALGPYYVRQLDASLQTEWQYTSTNTMSCALDDTGHKVCTDDHPHGFEWCINAPAVDKNGVVYANNEDGNIYAIPQGGDANLAGVTSMFLQQALGSAYTPLAIDAQGRILALNDGRLTIIGQ